ncbi:MAG: Ig-like domain-containing protein [Chloroflexi bacterium]|nr:Ig-like domain-containing protein [Chloroflexota bacterium]
MKRSRINYRKWGTVQRTTMVAIMVFTMLVTMFVPDIAIAADADITPPNTSEHYPAGGDTDVPVDTNIVVHVLDAGDGVDQSTIAMTVEGLAVTPDITGSPADYTLTYDPPDFANEQVVNVTVDASDLAGIPMAQDVYSFTTEPAPDMTPPYIYGRTPDSGAIDVPVDTDITFAVRDDNSGVDQSSIVMTVVGSIVTPIISGSTADTIVLYNPSSDFSDGQVVDVTVDASDIAGNPMVQDVYSFTIVAAPADTTQPTTSEHDPISGATDVPVDTNIVVHVLDAGDGVDQSTIVMTVEGLAVTPDITGSPADYTLTYDPPSDFTNGQVVDVYRGCLRSGRHRQSHDSGCLFLYYCGCCYPSRC